MSTPAKAGPHLRLGTVAVAVAMLATACAGSLGLSGRGAAFWYGVGGCSDRDGPPPESWFITSEPWLELLGGPLSAVQSDGDEVTASYLVVDVGPGGRIAGEPFERSVRMDATSFPGAVWGVEAGGRTFITLRRSGAVGEEVQYVLVRHPDGSHFFAGQCMFEFMTRHFQRKLGARYDSVMATLVGERDLGTIYELILEPDELPRLVGGDRPGSRHLRGLNDIVLFAELPVAWKGPWAICTKIDLGWNECVNLTHERLGPVNLDTFVPDDGELRVWLVGARGEGSHHTLQHLADVNLTEATEEPLRDGMAFLLRLRGEFEEGPAIKEPRATLELAEIAR